MRKNKLCEVLGIEKPVIQGPMAWSSFAPLVAAVSNAGGLGVLGVGSARAELIREQIQKTRALTDKPFGVNVFLYPPELPPILEVLLEEKPPVVYADVLFNLDSELCKSFFTPLKEVGIKIIVKASMVKDAITAAENGADVVIAKGWEGGGHVTPESTMALLPQVTQLLSVPVIGSGGIADGRGMAAAIALGADGIEMGSAFLCSEECTIHQNAKDAILAAGDMRSVITGTCNHEPCRQLSNKYTDEMIDLEWNHPASEVSEKIRDLATPALRTAMRDGDVENGALMVGMIAPLIKEIRPAAKIIDDTLLECKEVLSSIQQFVF
ncbi:MAG: nitronate monooxygenase [Oscillospiraceae bacterium]|nr:nitronate monooxygenase [Oscillospiraceae bacterium]